MRSFIFSSLCAQSLLFPTFAQICDVWSGVPHEHLKPTTEQCGVLYFLHLQKAGGTTVSTRLTNCGMNRKFPVVNWRHSPKKQDIPWYVRDSTFGNPREDFKTLAAHIIAEPQPLAVVIHHMGAPGFPSLRLSMLEPLRALLGKKGCKLMLTTMIRDPTQRTISSMYYNKLRKFSHSFVGRASNVQATMILEGWPSWNKSAWDLRRQSPHLFDDARSALKDFDAVGRTEELGLFWSYINDFLRCPEPRSNIFNPSTKLFNITETQMQIIRSSNDADRRLYDNYCSETADSPGDRLVSV